MSLIELLELEGTEVLVWERPHSSSRKEFDVIAMKPLQTSTILFGFAWRSKGVFFEDVLI